MKKGLVSVLVLIACIAVLAFSYLSWNAKVKEAGAEPVNRPIKQEQPAEEDEGEDPAKEEESEGPSGDELTSMTANLPESTVEMLMSRLDDGEAVQLLAVGSSSFEAPASQLADALSDAYGGWIKTDIQTFSGTSEAFMEESFGDIDWDKGYDLVIYEPFTLYNNGLVTIDDEQQDALDFRERVLKEVDDATFFITPPQPMHQPNYYLTQISALHKFVDDRDIPFIDHWDEWPNADSDDILDYVGKEYEPTDKGVEAWAESLKAYFIAS